jgi:hypothetical protein
VSVLKIKLFGFVPILEFPHPKIPKKYYLNFEAALNMLYTPTFVIFWKSELMKRAKFIKETVDFLDSFNN